MSFEPCSAEHAIEEVSFLFACTRSFSEGDIDAIRVRRNQVRGELPAISALGDEPGVRLGYVRTNGTPVWQVRVSGNTIAIDCTRYTRWDRVWERANRYADFVLAACAEQQAIQIGGLGLNVIDRFESGEAAYDLQTLFTPSDLIPRSLFERGNLWSTEQRWVGQSLYGASGQALEISCQHVSRFVQSTGENRHVSAVTVEHSQELRLVQPIGADLEDGQDQVRKSQLMGELHLANKQLMDQLLVDEMKGKIGLWREA